MTNINKHKSTLCLLAIFALIVCANAQGSLMIIGGGKRPSAIISQLITTSGVDKKGYIVILPMASGEQDSSIFYTKKQFVNAGIDRITGFIINKNDKVDAKTIDSIANASLLYIGGGDQTSFMNIVAGTEVEKAIKDCYKKGNVIAGTSAGAAVMSEKMITGVELNHKSTTEDTERQGFETIEANNVEISTGLGFLKNAIIDQHFIKRKRYNRLIAVAIENASYSCIGIDEGTAIYVKNGIAQVVGDSQVIKISNSNKIVKSVGGKLAAKGLKLDVYISGDRFKVD